MQTMVEKAPEAAEPETLLRQLRARLKALDATIKTAATVEAMIEREEVQKKLAAATVVRDKAAARDTRARINDRRAKHLEEVDAALRDLWRVMPELRMILIRLVQLEEGGVNGWRDERGFDELTGLHLGSCRRLTQAIAAELQGTALGQAAHVPDTSPPPAPVAPVPHGSIQVLVMNNDPRRAG